MEAEVALLFVEEHRRIFCAMVFVERTVVHDPLVAVGFLFHSFVIYAVELKELRDAVGLNVVVETLDALQLFRRTNLRGRHAGVIADE